MIQLKAFINVQGSTDGKNEISCTLIKYGKIYVFTALIVLNPVVIGLIKSMFDILSVWKME